MGPVVTPTPLSISSPFTDHLVLQQGRPHPIWGRAPAGAAIELRVFGDGGEVAHAETTATADGRWRVNCPELPAGGPYELLISGGGECRLRDVLVGEVWLASGQSNMEWPLARSEGADDEIEAADGAPIRMLKVGNRVSDEPLEELAGEWRVASRANLPEFSAVGWFFARELQRHLGVPVGIIDSSWGGTPIEAWLSRQALAPVCPNLDEQLAELAEQRARLDELRTDYQREVDTWQQSKLPADLGNQGETWRWHEARFDDRAWAEMSLPGMWQSQGLRYNGVVWFRRRVRIPEAWRGRELTLSLGAIDDFDHTYVGGRLVGSHPAGTPEAFQIPRRYRVAPELTQEGELVIAVRVFDHFGEGGFAGPRSSMALSLEGSDASPVSLTGAWRYAVEREIPLVPVTVFESYPPAPLALALQYAPTQLHSGMIAPLAGYGVHGAIWYQGESNVGRAALYRDQLVALVRDWRRLWPEASFPVYWVQLAAHRSGEGWPLLREAQDEARSEPNTGLVTAIDVGDPDNIHPTNKRAVGERLARLALAEACGVPNIAAHGPELQSVRYEGPRARVAWRHAEGLTSRDDRTSLLGFELAGPDGAFVAARATFAPPADPAGGRSGSPPEVWVEAPGVLEARAVRYAFRDYLELNLVNGAGLPALPFRTDTDPA